MDLSWYIFKQNKTKQVNKTSGVQGYNIQNLMLFVNQNQSTEVLVIDNYYLSMTFVGQTTWFQLWRFAW